MTAFTLTTTPALAALPAWLDLARGAHGEIFSPALIGEADTDETLLAELVAANERLGQPIHVAGHGQSRAGMVNVALLYTHQMRMREALAGHREADPVATVVRQAVVERGQPLSLNPPSLEVLRYATFAPVFQCLTPSGAANGDARWRVGLAEQGKVEEYAEADPGRALARAQRLYVDWSAADNVAFETQVKRALEALPVSLLHDYWRAILEERESWDFGGGYRLTLLGRHVTMQLDLPTGTRIIETERGRAVRIADALSRQAGVTPDWPLALHLRAWLAEEQAPTPEQVEWGKGPGGLPARVLAGGREYMLVKRQNTLVFHAVQGGQYTAQLAETYLEPPMAAWLEGADADGRLALLSWALWKGRVLSESKGQSRKAS